MGTTRIDGAAIRAAGQRFDLAAEVLDDAVRIQFGGMRFDGAVAGRRHVASGDAVNDAVIKLGEALAQWSRAAVEIAVTLRGAVSSFVEAEYRIAEQV